MVSRHDRRHESNVLPVTSSWVRVLSRRIWELRSNLIPNTSSIRSSRPWTSQTHLHAIPIAFQNATNLHQISLLLVRIKILNSMLNLGLRNSLDVDSLCIVFHSKRQAITRATARGRFQAFSPKTTVASAFRLWRQNHNHSGTAHLHALKK